MLLDDLIEYVLPLTSGRNINDVRAGLGYTCVQLEDCSCGLAYTFRNELGNSCGTMTEAGRLIGRSCAEIVGWAKNTNRLMAAIGLAAINAVLNSPKTDWETGNITTALDVSSSDTFGMIGDFRPIFNEIKNKANNIYVFEQDPAKIIGLYPEDSIPRLLPQCDVVVITSTSIINHTIDQVLTNCKNAREVCLVGPSTPLCPELFKLFNVTLLAGTVVQNPELILQIISQGGGTMSMKPAVKQVLARVEQAKAEMM